MHNFRYLAYIFCISFFIISCKSEYKFKLTTSKKTTIGSTISASLQEVNGKPVDSVHFFINGNRVPSKNNSISVNTKDYGVGKYLISAIAFYPQKAKKLNGFVEVFAQQTPTVYRYKIINSYPHSTKAFTQGLEFKDGYIYETTGRRGKSFLRKIELETGKVVQEKALDKLYFGEGMTIFDDQIYWLTWQAGKGFIYDFNTFKQEGEFKYNKSLEGWGLTHNETDLIKSDGTNRIWFLDPKTLKEKRYIQGYTNKLSLQKLNELEWVNGKIYANYWQKPLIAIINPNNGSVEGIADLTGLVKEMRKTQRLIDGEDVLNGIAYDAQNNRLFVTGKRWAKLFEIELVKQ